MRIDRFEDIEAWQLARELTQKVYGLTKNLAGKETWNLLAALSQQRKLRISNSDIVSLQSPVITRFIRVIQGNRRAL